MPKVSVIVPVYGVEKYIERCARSLFEQTLDDIEYLFIDDCTPDRSIEILQQVLEDYPQRKPQVVIHRMEQNSGQAAVRKWGMQNATGEYVIHCDSDDWVDTDMYRAMYEKAKDEDADVVVCDYRTSNGIDVLEEIQGTKTDKISKFRRNLLFQRDPWSLCNKLFVRVCYKDIIYPDGNMGEDMAMCLQMIFKCNRMAHVSDVYYYYYINDASITNKLEAAPHLRNYESLKINTNLLLAFLENQEVEKRAWVINGLEYNVTLPLLNLIHSDIKYRDLWLNTYPGVILKYVVNPYMKIERRIKCLMALIGVYPFKKDRIK